MAGERADPGSEHGHPGVPLDLAPGLEPAEPALELGQPAVGVGGQGDLPEHPGGPVGVAGGHGVPDGRRGEVVGGTPFGRPPGQLHGQAGLAALELAAEQLAEEPVQPVPPPAPVEGGGQEVRPGQGLEQVGRPGGGQHGVAQGTGQAVQHRAAGQEPDQPLREVGEQLELEVVDQDAVVPGQGDRPGGLPAPGAGGADREVQGHRPALGPPHQLGHVDTAGVDVAELEQGAGLADVHRQVLGADLHHPALGAQTGQRQGRLAAAGDGQLRPLREVVDQPGHGVQAVRVVQQVDVVEHEHGRQLGHGQGRAEPREDRVDGGGALGVDLVQQVAVDRPDPFEDGGEAPEQDGRVVVAPVDRQPPEHPRVALGPLGQQGRLPVARRSEDGGHRGTAGGFQQVEEAGPGNLGVGPETGVQLGRDRHDGPAGHRSRPTSVAGTRATMPARPAAGIIQMG
jgi:hypothetical protein